MARVFRKPILVTFSCLMFLSATGIVVASPSWSHRIISGVAAAPYKIVKAAHRPATAAVIGTADADYVQGLARAVPGLVSR